jgi:D-alanyl-lipoteichoic acid acyltransferase DltB (MBOAT superfamily)
VRYDSLYFAFFLGFVWLAFLVLPWRGWILLAASILFYAAAGVRDSVLAAVVVLSNYGFQFLIERDRRWLYPALLLDFGCLAYFKYRVFLAAAVGFDVFTHDLVIPLGISFYIFQLSAFLIDISRGRAQPFHSLARFALFKLFFSQLVAGPITRWRQLGPQVHRLFDGKLFVRSRFIGLGLGLCLLGLVKKVLLADSIGPIVDAIFRDGPAGSAAAWLGAWLFTFQIYFDFSGYSDIAIGSAYLFGIRLPLNFATPLLAPGIAQFWQRWHMTLTRYLRDYVFVPLADARIASRRYRVAQHFFAMTLTMTLCGLWHGASFTFVLWGALQGIAIMLATMWSRHFRPLPSWIAWAATLVFCVATAVFFRSPSLGYAFDYLGTMFGLHGGYTAVPAQAAAGWQLPSGATSELLIVTGCIALLALHWLEAQVTTLRAAALICRLDGMFLRMFFAGSAIWLLLLPKVQDNPFIYFRF